MGPEALAQVLRPLSGIFNARDFPDLLVGLEISDDAAVYKINDEEAVIQTLDFFTPVVDDPYEFGAIAAANSMSDVYAMGGEVKLALNICGFPCGLEPGILTEILRGGAEKVREAGGIIAGGHTIDVKEPFYGLSMLGLVHPEKIFTKAAARPGDVLILTKPLGVGIITTAAKGEAAAPAHVAGAAASMKKLNRDASRIFQKLGVRACTDITGFALLGHAYEMAEKSGAGLHFSMEALPLLDGAKEYANQWLFPGGAGRNQKCYENHVEFSPDVPDEMRQLLFTPETSGGLLAAVPAGKIALAETLFAEAGHPFWLIGSVREADCGRVIVEAASENPKIKACD
jgi:selenide,water dikinase